MFRRLEVLLILLCLSLSVALYSYAKSAARLSADTEFEELVEDGVRNLENRLSTYLQSLNGAAAYLLASERVDAEEFAAYVETLNIEKFLPGINGIGLIVPVMEDEIPSFLEEVARDVDPRFNIHPRTERDEKLVIKFVSPLEPNRQALGLDIAFEEGRRNAAVESRATGQPRLTPRVLLVQDSTQQPGFLLLRPVYENEINGVAPTADRGIFRGWVYAPFIGNNLLSGLTKNQGRNYDLAVYDGLMPDTETLIFDSAMENAEKGRFVAAYDLNLYGRTWHVTFNSTPGFDQAYSTVLPLLILFAGIALTILLAVSLRTLRLRGDAMSEVADLRSRQLGAREQENRSIIENTVAAVFLLDERGIVLFTNEAAQDAFGYSDAEMKGRPFDDFLEMLSKKPTNHGFNARGTGKNGSRLMLDVQTNPWTTADSQPRTTAIVRDVTTEINARLEVEETKRRYDLAISGAEIGIFDVDLTTGESVVSKTWHQIMGTTAHSHNFDSQAHFISRIHPDDLPALTQADRACIEGLTERSTAEYRVRFGDGTWRWMRSDAVVVKRSREGTALRLVGTQADVTDLHRSRNALEMSEERFRLVIEEAPVGMALMNDQGKFVGVNDALCKLSGYDRSELMNGMRLANLLEREDIKVMYEQVSRLAANGKSKTYQIDRQINAKDGSRRWGLFNVSWTFDKNAQANVYIAQIVDITDQKKLEQIKSEFVATVSHELRTPLTSIKGALGLFEASGAEHMTPASARLIEIAKTNADRLTAIVNDILDLEKISSGEIVFNYENIGISEIASASVDEMMPFSVGHRNTLFLQLPDDDITVYADVGRTKQVLANLISNACKYSDPDTDVTIRVERIKDEAIVFVQNIGPGVPESFRQRIFQAFSQADGSDTRSKGGTGLGLNITRQIVWRQGGNVGFESVPGGPTVFWFTCPISVVNTLVPKAEQPTLRKIDTGSMRILHLEDDLDFAEVFRSGIKDDAEVTNVVTLAEARVALAKGQFDVVLLDWSVPDGNGSEIIDLIKESNSGAKIIGLSADSTPVEDPRIVCNLIKSRTEMAQVVRIVRNKGAKNAGGNLRIIGN